MSERDETAPESISKSQRKRDMTALQKLGETLVELPAAQLGKLPLPEALREAVHHARAITSRSARRRQLQYIGRLMREVDADPIRAALEALQGTDRLATARLQRLERHREELIGDDAALAAFLADFPQADHQHLRQLIRNARRERAAGAPAGAGRSLFRYLRELLEADRG